MLVRIRLVFVTVCGLQLVQGATKSKVQPDSSIIFFPGQTNGLTTRFKGEENVPEECRNKTYCDIKPKDYPQEYFNKMFKGSKETAPMLITTNDRASDPDEKSDCESVVEYKPLFQVRSKRGWHTVAQAAEENYVQMVRLETCVESDNPCFTQFSIPVDLITFCKQKTSEWEFVVMKEDQSGTEKVQIELPICCSCHYKSKGM